MSRKAAENAVASAQIRGARDYQEDSLEIQLLAPDAGVHANELLLVLADGMGGHAGGEVASRLVVEHFCAAYRDSIEGMTEALRGSLARANEALAGAVADEPRLGGMGTTLVSCVVKENSLCWISVGDSPLWVYRGGALRRLNADHSMVPLLEQMARAGELSLEEVATDPHRSLLRSALTGKAVDLVDLCDQPFRLEAGDIVILASDGIETLAENDLAALLQDADVLSMDELARKLLAGVKAAGRPYQDNASVILYRG